MEEERIEVVEGRRLKCVDERRGLGARQNVENGELIAYVYKPYSLSRHW